MGAVLALALGVGLPTCASGTAIPTAAVLCPDATAFSTEVEHEITRRGTTSTAWVLTCDGVPANEQPSPFLANLVAVLLMLPLGLAAAFGIRALWRWADEP